MKLIINVVLFISCLGLITLIKTEESINLEETSDILDTNNSDDTVEDAVGFELEKEHATNMKLTQILKSLMEQNDGELRRKLALINQNKNLKRLVNKIPIQVRSGGSDRRYKASKWDIGFGKRK
jgi:hypothetical protein